MKNIRTQRPSKKLDNKQNGPFPILEKIGPTSYKLQLPANMKIHPVCHSSLLRLDPDDPVPGQVTPTPPPVVIDGEDHWNVEEILDSRWNYRKLQYRVAWEGYPPDPEWYDASLFNNARD